MCQSLTEAYSFASKLSQRFYRGRARDLQGCIVRYLNFLFLDVQVEFNNR